MPFDLPPPQPAVEVSIASRGYSKGLVQTDGPQLLVRGELGLGSLYGAVYWKNVASPVVDGEAGILVGARGPLAGIDLQASLAFKQSTGVDGPVDADACEFALSASRTFGQVTPRLNIALSPDELGGTRESLYVEAGASYRFFSGTTVGAFLGRRERSGGTDYTSFNLGVTQQVTPDVAADLRYYDTAEGALGEIDEGRLVAAARIRF